MHGYARTTVLWGGQFAGHLSTLAPLLHWSSSNSLGQSTNEATAFPCFLYSFSCWANNPATVYMDILFAFLLLTGTKQFWFLHAPFPHLCVLRKCVFVCMYVHGNNSKRKGGRERERRHDIVIPSVHLFHRERIQLCTCSNATGRSPDEHSSHTIQ